MAKPCGFLLHLGLVCGLSATAAAAAPSRHDQEFIARGCVASSTNLRGIQPPLLFLWSRGDVYLALPETRAEAGRPEGTAPRVFYWIDDEDELADYLGLRVEIAGTVDDAHHGELEIERHHDFVELEFEVHGHEARAILPAGWLWPVSSHEVEFDVPVRVVDVDRVTVLGIC
jgi:hypothetical protein